MDFSGVTSDTSAQVTSAVDGVLVLDLSPEDKQSRIARIISSVGSHYHTQLYEATSQVFDSSTMKSAGIDDANSQADRLALKIVRNYALARDTSGALITGYYNSLLAQAQSEAFKNAKSMQRHPTLTRTVTGRTTCQWCQSRAGTHVDPTSSDFARHKDDDCILTVSGYNTRNGQLTNYTKQGGKR